MKVKWVEVLYFDGVGIQNTYGTIEGTIEESILNKKDDDWVRLDNVRHIDESGTSMEKLEDDIVGTESYFYLRVRSIVRVAPIRTDVTFWEEGTPPLAEFTESQENN